MSGRNSILPRSPCQQRSLTGVWSPFFWISQCPSHDWFQFPLSRFSRFVPYLSSSHQEFLLCSFFQGHHHCQVSSQILLLRLVLFPIHTHLFYFCLCLSCGAFSGGILFGYISQFTGRRLAILGALLWVACFIPLWILPSSFSALSAGAFFLQFGVQGAWGV